MLVALALAGLVVTITGRIAVQSLQTQTFVSRQVRDAQRVAQLDAVLSDDIAHRLTDADDPPPVVVTGGSQVVWESFVLAANLDVDEAALHIARRPSFVRYRLVSADSPANTSNLIREVTDRTNPGAVVRRETIATHLTLFEVQWLLRGAWEASTSADSESLRQAEAVRFQCRWEDKS